MKTSQPTLFVLSIAAIFSSVMMFVAMSADVKNNAAAKVDIIIKEDALNTIALSKQAADSLGIETAKTTMKDVRRTHFYGGEIVTPIGKRGAVTAPISGLLKALPQGAPKSGEKVTKGQKMFMLLPFLTMNARNTTTTSQIDAKTQTDNAAIQMHAAKIALDLAKRLFADGVGAKRTIVEAQATYETAKEMHNAAQSRQIILEDLLVEGTAEPITITAPIDGVLRNVINAQGQNVPAGAVLFELGDISSAWVRVTLPMADLDDVDLLKQAHIGGLSAHASQPMQPAFPVQAQPLANPLTYTMDVLYMLHDSTERVIAGNRVGVLIPAKQSSKNLTIPTSAVIVDALGGSWIYEKIAPFTYARKRVVVRYVSGDESIVESGLEVGTSVVTIGAQALFGAETGTMK